MALIKVANENDMKDGEARVVEANGNAIALYRVNGEFFATTNTCIHKGGPLGEGFLNDDVITCPWHGWQFNVKTGVSPVNPAAKIETYKVHVKDGEVFVEV